MLCPPEKGMAKKGEFLKVNKAGEAAKKTVNDMFSQDAKVQSGALKEQKQPLFSYYYSLSMDMLTMLDRIAIKWGCKKSLAQAFEKLFDESVKQIDEIKSFAASYDVVSRSKNPPKRSSVLIPVSYKSIIDDLQMELSLRKYTDLTRVLVAYHAAKMGID